MASDARRRQGRVVLTLVLSALLGGLAFAPGAAELERRAIDWLLLGRTLVSAPPVTAPATETVVVLVDEASFRHEPFATLPQIAWTPHLASVLMAIGDAAPRVVGLDLIYAGGLDRADILPGYDRDWRRALYYLGRSNRLVMARAQFGDRILAPEPAQVLAAGGAGNVRLANLLLDRDEVVRRYPLGFDAAAGGRELSFGAEIARRAGASLPAGEEFLVDFNGLRPPVKAFSFADLYACSQAQRQAFFNEHFRDKIVLIGSALDAEDRRLASERLAGQRSVEPPVHCVHDGDGVAADLMRQTIPGVFIHAAAVDTLMRGEPLRLLPRWQSAALVAAFAAVLVTLLLMAAPWAGLLLSLTAAAAAFAAGVAFLYGRWVLPVPQLLLGSGVVFATVYAYRFVVEDRARRYVRAAFGRYLSPAVVQRLIADPAALRLGGERKRVTVFFSDLAGFTTLSERFADDPERLIEVLNALLTEMVGIIERHGGYVDKFIGDAVMAVWGAPLADEHDGERAVDAALECLQMLPRLNAEVIKARFGIEDGLSIRIGINTDEVLVGNMGSASRLNYTVVGDGVNLAARLEGANKTYGTQLLVGEGTAQELGEGYLTRRVDWVRVKGKERAAEVFEVVGRRDEVPEPVRQRLAAFDEAMALYLQRRFDDALAAFAALAGDDPVAEVYRQRCLGFMQRPPGADWDGSFSLLEK